MEPDSKQQEISSIASNTPEQCQGDVDMLEHKDKILLSAKLPCDEENINNIVKEKVESNKKKVEEPKSKDVAERISTPPAIENIPEKTEKSLVKYEHENEADSSQPILSIDNSVLLSPPKSEPQGPIISPTDENTTASISPPSESQMSPSNPSDVHEIESVQTKEIKETIQIRPKSNETEAENSQDTSKEDIKFSTNSSSSVSSLSPSKKDKDNEMEGTSSKGTFPENYINLVANGTMPKSGKPSSAAALSKKLKSRGRPKQRKGIVAVYQSEISDNAVGIKLCIKKSDQTPLIKKSTRKRSRKPTYRDLDSENEEIPIGPEKRRRKEKTNNNSDRQKKLSDIRQPIDQSPWGCKIPEEILYEIFNLVVESEGCLPTLFRLGQVCTLWRKVSISPRLWSNLDWGSCIKDRYRTEPKLKWLIENRMRGCKELNISNWKVSDIQCVLYKLAESCPELVGITLSGWKGFTSDHLNFLVKEFKKLERIDLSSINVELHPSKSGVALQTLCFAIQTIGERLTHLHLAHNRLAGVPQIITTLSTYCPNLLSLDLSNVQTVAMSHGILHIEKLQKGCQKLKVLRITNSHITLSTASLQEQMESPGFPELEELSVASLVDESRLINDEFLQRILKTSTKLKLLDVRGCARLTHDSLIRLPAWDLKHLFLSGCSVTRDVGSGLELIASKWAHSLIEFDLAWANVQESLDNALKALAEKGYESPLTNLNLCGSSVSEEAVKEILTNCPLLNSINLSSCRGLPRGVKRFINGPQLKELRDVLKVTLKTSPKTDLSSN